MKKKQINNICLVVDASGSMRRFQERVRQVFSSLIEDIKGNTEQVNHVSVILFNTLTRNITPSRFSDEYVVGGDTALYDAIAHAAQALDGNSLVKKSMLPWEKLDVANLVIVLTDGEENASRGYTSAQIGSLIRQYQDKGDWTFVFQIPPGQRSYITRLGVPVENIREWAVTERGFVETMGATQSSLSSYYTSRSLGLKSVTNFYKAQTDLSDLSSKDLKSLNDLTTRFRSIPVKAEDRIDHFVEEHTGDTYLPGSAYYQLTKPEIIQSRKGVLIMQKGKKSIFGGAKARTLIGLKEFQDGKITPGNHSDFDIFVQSTSNNRKLVRGTKLLVQR